MLESQTSWQPTDPPKGKTMSSAATLLNLPHRICDVSALEGEWLGVAAGGYRLPVAWFRMFDSSDLGPCTIDFMGSDPVDESMRHEKAVILNPATSVRKALTRLAQSRSLFETLAGDPAIGHGHWAAAMAHLEQFPLPFLSIDPTDLLLMADLKTSADDYARAFGDDASALALVKKMSCYEEGFVAARHDHVDTTRGRNGPANNAAAISGFFFQPSDRIRSSRTAEAKQRWDAKLATMPLGW